MKLKFLNLLVLGSALTITAVGCKTKPHGLTPLDDRLHAPKDANRFGELPGGHPINEDGGVKPLNPDGPLAPTPIGDGTIDPNMPLKAETVYFDFDKASIRKSEQSKLENVASYLKSHPDVKVRVEGNCDERGTEEYNRSLGDRRALAAREYLTRLGIDPSKVETVSFGNDKPAESGHNESAWSKNRRDDFQVILPGK